MSYNVNTVSRQHAHLFLLLLVALALASLGCPRELEDRHEYKAVCTIQDSRNHNPPRQERRDDASATPGTTDGGIGRCRSRVA